MGQCWNLKVYILSCLGARRSIMKPNIETKKLGDGNWPPSQPSHCLQNHWQDDEPFPYVPFEPFWASLSSPCTREQPVESAWAIHWIWRKHVRDAEYIIYTIKNTLYIVYVVDQWFMTMVNVVNICHIMKQYLFKDSACRILGCTILNQKTLQNNQWIVEFLQLRYFLFSVNVCQSWQAGACHKSLPSNVDMASILSTSILYQV